ncbi:hypothetical protein H112_01076 [Trichophyton rubrum D6]|uniref:Uncharacterized protein n=1 Tax=Trichophyton soudanense CBS 452.61 TaxID=1215331 RepID=A0A022Y4F1_TRISD|nr:hypothetical protein H102_01066 [Trichophyton rubrum CBS 100081]EZF67197.1 hypothetical protein H104_01059 [Trichophyton rubrum CBS 289.86]EZF77800.1 hypothetical protein H105_01079 [Trichophyton soudanense CBS 452.61]EZF88385.1 hypothetical protein H110_01076 [Trichophyton rubrum MR1448]EZF99196.1 hypothetical protein H113_01076 [Trichophyton rubrum MR1459]EZG10388.1 hypothetical protein H106_00874 [Trichophyton rubrum CBS 735.88]EZG20816.1 hypothetical protein H107_01125 [Trichophyton ru
MLRTQRLGCLIDGSITTPPDNEAHLERYKLADSHVTQWMTKQISYTLYKRTHNAEDVTSRDKDALEDVGYRGHEGTPLRGLRKDQSKSSKILTNRIWTRPGPAISSTADYLKWTNGSKFVF